MTEFEPSKLPVEYEDEEQNEVLPDFKLSVLVFHLPEFYSEGRYAGRSDIGAPKEKIGELTNTDDMRGAVRKLADKPGAYLAEYRVDGKVRKSKVVQLMPSAERVQMETPRPARRTVSRIGPRVLVRSRPTSRAASSTSSDVERRLERIERAVLSIVEENQPSESQRAKSPVDDLKEAVALVKDLQDFNRESIKDLLGDKGQTNGNGKDPEESALLMLLKDEGFRSRVTGKLLRVVGGGSGEESAADTWPEMARRVFQSQPELADKITDRGFRLVEYLGSSLLSGKRKEETEGAAEIEDGHDDDTGAESDEVTNIMVDPERLVQILAAKLATNAPARDAAELVQALAQCYPEHVTKFGLLPYAPIDLLMSQVGEFLSIPTELLELPHARAWFEKLQLALREGE